MRLERWIWKLFRLPEPCEIYPWYSECCIYQWNCDRCGLSQSGEADQMPPCADRKRKQYRKWSNGKS